MVSSNPPRKIVNYPIAGDPNGGALFIYGDSNAKKMAIMSAGFPDDQEVFLPFASRLAKETDTLVGVTCVPGYDDRPDKPWTDHKKDGYTFDEMAIAFREAAKVLRSESTCPSKPKFTGIFHDWGVIPGSTWANRAIEDDSADAPDELVLFDVLLGPHPQTKDRPHAQKPSMHEIFITIYYRFVYAFSFFMQSIGFNLLAGIFFGLGNLSMQLFKLGPLYQIDIDIISGRPQLPLRRFIYMCYPYFYMFKTIVLDGGKALTDATLPKDLKKTPVLYLYGKEKRIMFHDYVSVKILEREHAEGRSPSNAIAVDDAGHWLYVQKPDLCFDAVKDFMQGSQGGAVN